MTSVSQQQQQEMQFSQISELDPVWLVLTHRPSLEIFCGSIHPSGSLFETGLSSGDAVQAHENFLKALREFGCVPKVLTVADVLTSAPHDRLVELAASVLQYEFQGNPSVLDPQTLPQFSDDYKLETLQVKKAEELVQIILTRPTVVLTHGNGHVGLTVSSVTLRPLSNLVFVRDQQIVTARGLVMGSLRNEQRKHELAVLELCFRMLGVPVLGCMSGDATLEGGDFLPFSADLCFLGIGIRTNTVAARQLMKRDLLGTRRLALVIDALDRQQKRMHLDTVFNIVDETHVLVWEPIINDPSKKRFVDLYEFKHGQYDLTRSHVDFVEFLEAEGFTVIPITEAEQTDYMINFLSLGRRPGEAIKIISVHPGLADKLKAAGVTGVEVESVDYRGITRMYGAAHCSSQCFRNSSSVRLSRAASPLSATTASLLS